MCGVVPRARFGQAVLEEVGQAPGGVVVGEYRGSAGEGPRLGVVIAKVGWATK